MGYSDLFNINKTITVFEGLPESLGGTLKAHRRRRKLTQFQLAEYTLICTDTIGRIENEKIDEPNLETLIALMVGLKLEFKYSMDLLVKSGYIGFFLKAKKKKKYVIYQEILFYEGKYTVIELNEMLVKEGMKPLTKDED